jgi:mitogen-activated protein kinase 1/3
MATQTAPAGTGGSGGASASASTSSNIPIRKTDGPQVPGKATWVLWRTNFEIDLHYQPIKAIGKG